MGRTYTELSCEKRPRLCQPISGKNHVRLCRGRLRQLEKDTRGLCQRLSHIKYDILQVIWERAEIVALVQLLGSCQRVRHVCHFLKKMLE